MGWGRYLRWLTTTLSFRGVLKTVLSDTFVIYSVLLHSSVPSIQYVQKLTKTPSYTDSP